MDNQGSACLVLLAVSNSVGQRPNDPDTEENLNVSKLRATY